MTYTILDADFLLPGIKRLCVLAPLTARSCYPGQYVVIRIHEGADPVPLPIVAAPRFPGAAAAEYGTLVVIVRTTGAAARGMNLLTTGDSIRDVTGPLGCPSRIERYGTVVVVGVGLGAACAFPIAAALREAGNRVLAVLGADSRRHLVLEHEMGEAADELVVVTEDGSRGRRGGVADALQALIEGGEDVDRVVIAGPITTMRAVAAITRGSRIPTVVNLGSLMVDGGGMCGACRVTVGGQTRFACVDGPEFDGHAVDFDVLTRRMATQRRADRDALARYLVTADRQRDDPRGTCRLEELHPELSLGADLHDTGGAP